MKTQKEKHSAYKKKKIFQTKEVTGQFPLLDCPEPNLYRHLFPYDEVCRVEFDNKFVFRDSPDEREIYSRLGQKCEKQKL